MLDSKIIKDLISRVNKTLSYYEKDYISVLRTPYTERERCSSFEQYVEARFNFECFRIPELYDLMTETDGHAFICDCLENQDTSKRRFSSATIVLAPGLPENLKNEISLLVGGSQIKFNNVKKKIKFEILK